MVHKDLEVANLTCQIDLIMAQDKAQEIDLIRGMGAEKDQENLLSLARVRNMNHVILQQ